VAAPIIGAGLIRIGGGMALRRVSMGNALTGLGMGFRLMDLVEDEAGNVYQVVQDTTMPSPMRRMDNIPIPSGKKTKRKRKVSKYQKAFGRNLKILKKKHPRTSVTKLMKKAHIATRKGMKK